ncbi:ABC transporter substrate-binding protein [Arthrobacter luteolus]|uniref:ABC transporter substrate-binding protein n=1 Tax=Arthrobacter luteolus TaxID=98672 RepID=UPI000831C72B|nr:ABC transporter substrate-binding protein [Arthrobacter luteolus]
MKKATTAALLTVSALALSACSSGGDNNGNAEAAGGNVPLNIGEFADVTSWDPSLADIGFDGPYLSAVYDPLLGVDTDGNPTPALATEWEVSEDFLTVTMELRTDAVFSDGEPFNADAAVASLEYLKEGARSQEAYLSVDSFEAVDEDTIEINLAERDDTLLYFMGLGRSYMMSPKAIESGTLAEAPVGSGPYTMASSSVAGAEYHFDKVADHWAADQFKFEPLAIYPIQDATARNNAMLSGQVNLNYADQAALDQAEANSWNVAKKVSGWVGLQFTDRAGDSFEPLGDERVRQALNYAFNGAEILGTLGSGAGEPTNQVFPFGMPGHVAEIDEQYAVNLDKAKKLLADAGYADGFDITMPMSQVFQVWQPSVDQVFGELGIKVTWEDMQYMDYQTKAATYPMFVSFLSMDSHPVANVLRQISTPQWYNPNPQMDKFPEVQAQVEKVLTAAPADQLAEVETLNRLVTDKAWFSVFYQANNSYVSAENIEVTPVTGMMFPTLRQISVKG